MAIGRRGMVLGGTAVAGAALLLRHGGDGAQAMTGGPGAATSFPVSHTDAEWHRLLSPAAYDVLREQGTEMPFSSPLDAEHRSGRYSCAGCGEALYDSRTKFDSGTGWPSFFQPLPSAIATASDDSLGFERRTEVHCARCGGHLGHVFADGPPPTGLRYCMNGVALRFTPVQA